MARADYEGVMAANYDAGRGLLPETVAAWRDAVMPFVPRAPEPALDLGAGTGRFSGHLADWLDRPVVAVEPAAAMRSRAASKDSGRVWTLGGAAERVPVRGSTCSLAWISNAYHHFDDGAAAARELARVLVPGSPVFVRGWFHDVNDDLRHWNFFPSARAVARSFPGAADVRAAFEPAGFRLEETLVVDQVVARTLDDLVERVRLRADSTLEPIPDTEFEAGLASLEEVAAKEPAVPVAEPLALLVLRTAG